MSVRAKLTALALAPVTVVGCNGAAAPPDVPMAAADASPPPPEGVDETDREPPAPVSTAAPPGTASASDSVPFDRGAAAKALGSVDIRPCAAPGGPTGSGHVTVIFSPSGRVAAASVDGGPFPRTTVGGCVATRFRSVRIPAFSGGNVNVGKSFTLP